MSSLVAERVETDVAVVGAGPAGIAAAVSAAGLGRRVVVLDEGGRAGGQIWRNGGRFAAPRAARAWLERLERSGARVLTGTTVVDGWAPGVLLAEQGGRPLRIEAGAIVLATGARERLLPFPGWTLPGVLGVGGIQALVKSGLDVAGRRVVLAGSGPLLLPVAATLTKAGARVLMVAEQAPTTSLVRFGTRLWRTPGRIAQAARYRYAFRRTPYRSGWWVERADGEAALRAVTLTDGRDRRREECDLLGVGYGLVPSTELARTLGCRLDGEVVVVDDEQRTTAGAVWCAGEPTGVAGVDAALAEGEIAGMAAAGGSAPRSPRRVRSRERSLAHHMERAFALRPELKLVPDDETIVCRCEDVRLGELRSDWTARQAKLVTRAGMGSCQGRICGAAIRFLHDSEPDSQRTPILPAAMATLTDGLTADTPEQGEP